MAKDKWNMFDAEAKSADTSKAEGNGKWKSLFDEHNAKKEE